MVLKCLTKTKTNGNYEATNLSTRFIHWTWYSIYAGILPTDKFLN